MSNIQVSQLVQSSEDLRELVQDPASLIRKRQVSEEDAPAVHNISSIIAEALKVSPMTLSELSTNYLDSFRNIDAAAAQGFTDSFTNKFEKSYSNSKGALTADIFSVDESLINLETVASLSTIIK